MGAIHLHALASRYKNIRAALVEISNLQSVLTLPKPTVHIVSDVHGEYVKLRHVVNNASGSLRPLLDRLFGAALTPAAVGELATMFYYPREAWLLATKDADVATRRTRLRSFAKRAAIVLRELARHYSLKYVEHIIPDPFDGLFRELLFGAALGRAPGFVDALIEPYLVHGRDDELVRVLARAVRNLSVGELIVAGDLGDRGPRIDKVIDILMQQPRVAITWGNHDTVWMAACLGHAASLATVVRLSLRYRRLGQLEEGYGIPMAPLEKLARERYGEDPATRFACKGEGLRDSQLMARMQKAIAIIQFKVEGQLFSRRADWALQDRALLHRIDPAAGTITIAGVVHPLLDTALPTIDWADPYRLSDDEARCLARLTQSFLGSQTLWKQMSFVASHGQMALRRDRCAIFHGCVPVDADGVPLDLVVDGVPRRGKALFDALDVVVQRAFRKHAEDDLDVLFYLWTGPLSPCFGKDKMATFETYFVADKAAQAEHKNPYFKLLHDPAFCAAVLREFGTDPELGFIINGHVPVKLEKGETPIKESGRAITIDGAFAAAYGDKGFSLVLDAQRIYLAEHHHFESIDAAVSGGADIVPTVSDVQVHDRVRTVGDTELGDELRAEITALEELVRAFEANLVREVDA